MERSEKYVNCFMTGFMLLVIKRSIERDKEGEVKKNCKEGMEWKGEIEM